MPNTVADLNKKNIDEVVRASWTNVMNLVEDGHPLSSEKTLCFLFAMEMWKHCNGKIQLDFENYCYKKLQGKSKYLDLLVCTSKGFKAAIEFKLPQKSKTGNSNQTQTRVAVYRDLARLAWLKNNSIIADASYFLMATNENPYLNNTNINEYPNFLTRHGHEISCGNSFEVEGLPMHDINCKFHWHGISCDPQAKSVGRYAWLEPIRV